MEPMRYLLRLAHLAGQLKQMEYMYGDPYKAKFKWHQTDKPLLQTIY